MGVLEYLFVHLIAALVKVTAFSSVLPTTRYPRAGRHYICRTPRWAACALCRARQAAFACGCVAALPVPIPLHIVVGSGPEQAAAAGGGAMQQRRAARRCSALLVCWHVRLRTWLTPAAYLCGWPALILPCRTARWRLQVYVAGASPFTHPLRTAHDSAVWVMPCCPACKRMPVLWVRVPVLDDLWCVFRSVPFTRAPLTCILIQTLPVPRLFGGPDAYLSRACCVCWLWNEQLFNLSVWFGVARRRKNYW